MPNGRTKLCKEGITHCTCEINKNQKLNVEMGFVFAAMMLSVNPDNNRKSNKNAQKENFKTHTRARALTHTATENEIRK